MKKMVCLLPVILALFLGASALAQGDYIGDMKVVNCKEWVSFRVEPDEKAKRLAKVPLGEIVENCRVHDDDFTYAEYDGRCGFILSDYLEAVPVERMALGDLRVINCSNWVNMRAEPGIEAKVVTRVPAGSLVTGCTASDNGFIFGRYNGKEGYISSAYLGAADGTQSKSRLTDCRVQMVNMQALCGAFLLSQDISPDWSLQRRREDLEAALSGLPEIWRELALAVPSEGIVEVTGGRELYLIIPADEAAVVSVNELTPPTDTEPAKFERVIHHSASGKPFLLRCNASESPWEEDPYLSSYEDVAIPYDCEVNLVDSRGRGLTWYPYVNFFSGEMNTDAVGSRVIDLALYFEE